MADTNTRNIKNHIWSVAGLLRVDDKQSECGKVFLPLMVLPASTTPSPRPAVVDGTDVYRVDVAAITAPTWAASSRADRTLCARLNNLTRAIPPDKAAPVVAAKWHGQDR